MIFWESRHRIVLLLLFVSSAALAAKNGTIQGTGVTLYSDPNKSSDSVAKLNNGDAVLMSNYPTQGFYKVRTSTGQVGWVDSSSISVIGGGAPSANEPPSIPSPSGRETQLPPPSTLGAPSDTQVLPFYEDAKPLTNYEARQVKVPEDHPRYPFELKFFLGGQSESLSDVKQLAGSSVPSVGFYLGTQFGIPLDQNMDILLRVEDIISPSSGGVSSVPIMAGFSYGLNKEKAHEVNFKGSLLVGVAANTAYTNNVGGTAYLYSGAAFTEMLKVDMSLVVSPGVEIFGEAGYRFLKTATIGPTVGGQPTTGQSIISIDLSGPFIGVGVGFLL